MVHGPHSQQFYGLCSRDSPRRVCPHSSFPAVGTRRRPHSSSTWKRCRHQRGRKPPTCVAAGYKERRHPLATCLRFRHFVRRGRRGEKKGPPVLLSSSAAKVTLLRKRKLISFQHNPHRFQGRASKTALDESTMGYHVTLVASSKQSNNIQKKYKHI